MISPESIQGDGLTNEKWEKSEKVFSKKMPNGEDLKTTVITFKGSHEKMLTLTDRIKEYMKQFKSIQSSSGINSITPSDGV